ncbi:MAG: hypothetical protein WCY77_11960 [Weeksellaceae bacterium]
MALSEDIVKINILFSKDIIYQNNAELNIERKKEYRFRENCNS